jgi:phospholipase C
MRILTSSPDLWSKTVLFVVYDEEGGFFDPGLIEANITAWRRAVVGDLTSAFDFKKPNRQNRLMLPSTASYVPGDFNRHLDGNPPVPANQTLPQQEHGVRPAWPLPYALEVMGRIQDEGSFRIDFLNIGDASVVFQVRSGPNDAAPRTYTVEPGKQLSDAWPVTNLQYDLSVYGPNGFFREFQGGTDAGTADLVISDPAMGGVRIGR